jgi:hypothetical protein
MKPEPSTNAKEEQTPTERYSCRERSAIALAWRQGAMANGVDSTIRSVVSNDTPAPCKPKHQ